MISQIANYEVTLIMAHFITTHFKMPCGEAINIFFFKSEGRRVFRNPMCKWNELEKLKSICTITFQGLDNWNTAIRFSISFESGE